MVAHVINTYKQKELQHWPVEMLERVMKVDELSLSAQKV